MWSESSADSGPHRDHKVLPELDYNPTPNLHNQHTALVVYKGRIKQNLLRFAVWNSLKNTKCTQQITFSIARKYDPRTKMLKGGEKKKKIELYDNLTALYH